MKTKLHKMLIILSLLWLGIPSVQREADGNIIVEPGTTVEVGEEVFFDGCGVTIPGAALLSNGMIEGSYEWDFGDGYTFMKGSLYKDSNLGGTAVTHFYMRPGIYSAKLSVTDINGTNDVFITTITVKGRDLTLVPRPAIEPILELKFENNLDDTSPSGLTAQWQNGTGSFVQGAEGKAVDLTNGAYIEVSDSTGILSGMDELTISLWAKKKEIEGGYDIGKDLGIGYFLLDKGAIFNIFVAKAWGHFYAGGNIKTEDKSIIVKKWTASETGNKQWHHYVMTYDGSSARVFVDGIDLEDRVVALTGKIQISGDNLLIGRKFDVPDIFDGYIDEVKIYDKALTPEEAHIGFELWHADFHGHIAQYIYAQIPGEFTKNSTNKIKATVTGDTGFSKVLIDKSDLQSEEKFLLNNAELPAGNYALTVQILDSGNSLLDEIKEKFKKPFDGIPKAGIDENNAIRINGELFFPVTPFGLGGGSFDNWKARKSINALYNEGWYPTFNIDSWKDYLDKGEAQDWYVIGPGNWAPYAAQDPYRRNLDINGLNDYAEATQNHSALLMWQLGDEPDWHGVSSPVLRAWTYKFHELSPQHLVVTNYVGNSWVYGATRRHAYEYLYNANYFGGKKTHVVDVLGFDHYPIAYEDEVSEYADALDRMRDENYNLVPYMAFVETTNIGKNYLTGGPPIPTPEQLRMLTWLNVVHGVKGINWFHYFVGTPPENFAVMAEFVDRITKLTPVVLGPETDRVVTDNANEPGRRVDTMVREYGGNIYVFAVRLTEVNEANNPSIGVTFTVDGLTSDMAVIEPGEFSQSILEYKGDPAESRRTFSFTLNNTPIIPGTVQVAGQFTEDTPSALGEKIYLYDDGNGVLYGFPISWWYKDMKGTVNYQTGEVYVDFGQAKVSGSWVDKPILPGADMVRATYRPVKGDRIISRRGNTFTDRFAPNDVHIYKTTRKEQTERPKTEPYKARLKCYNNVFNPTKGEKALIWVEIKEKVHIKLALYDSRGRRIKKILDEKKEPPLYKYHWDGTNDSGNVVGSGLYFVHIQAGDYKKTKKIVVVK